MRRNALSLLYLLLIFWVPAGAGAAGFDCEKTTTRIETLICGTPSLSRLDSQLATVFKTALTAVAPSSKQALLTEQRHWINHTRDICQDAACIEEAYLKRIDVLARNEKYIVDRASCEIPDGASCRSVVVLRDPNGQLQSFNQSLSDRKIDAEIIGCEKLIDLPVGTAATLRRKTTIIAALTADVRISTHAIVSSRVMCGNCLSAKADAS